jgi:hypothetical protein
MKDSKIVAKLDKFHQSIMINVWLKYSQMSKRQIQASVGKIMAGIETSDQSRRNKFNAAKAKFQNGAAQSPAQSSAKDKSSGPPVQPGPVIPPFTPPRHSSSENPSREPFAPTKQKKPYEDFRTRLLGNDEGSHVKKAIALLANREPNMDSPKETPSTRSKRPSSFRFDPNPIITGPYIPGASKKISPLTDPDHIYRVKPEPNYPTEINGDLLHAYKDDNVPKNKKIFYGLWKFKEWLEKNPDTNHASINLWLKKQPHMKLACFYYRLAFQEDLALRIKEILSEDGQGKKDAEKEFQSLKTQLKQLENPVYVALTMLKTAIPWAHALVGNTNPDFGMLQNFDPDPLQLIYHRLSVIAGIRKKLNPEEAYKTVCENRTQLASRFGFDVEDGFIDFQEELRTAIKNYQEHISKKPSDKLRVPGRYDEKTNQNIDLRAIWIFLEAALIEISDFTPEVEPPEPSHKNVEIQVGNGNINLTSIETQSDPPQNISVATSTEDLPPPPRAPLSMSDIQSNSVTIDSANREDSSTQSSPTTNSASTQARPRAHSAPLIPAFRRTFADAEIQTDPPHDVSTNPTIIITEAEPVPPETEKRTFSTQTSPQRPPRPRNTTETQTDPLPEALPAPAATVAPPIQPPQPRVTRNIFSIVAKQHAQTASTLTKGTTLRIVQERLNAILSSLNHVGINPNHILNDGSTITSHIDRLLTTYGHNPDTTDLDEIHPDGRMELFHFLETLKGIAPTPTTQNEIADFQGGILNSLVRTKAMDVPQPTSHRYLPPEIPVH